MALSLSSSSHIHADVPAVDAAARHGVKDPLGVCARPTSQGGPGGATARVGGDVGLAGGIALLAAAVRLQGRGNEAVAGGGWGGAGWCSADAWQAGRWPAGVCACSALDVEHERQGAELVHKSFAMLCAP